MGIPMDFAYSKIFKSADISTISVKKNSRNLHSVQGFPSHLSFDGRNSLFSLQVTA
jgi:hypothetical protein